MINNDFLSQTVKSPNNEYEDVFIDYFFKNHRIRIERIKYDDKDYPELTILDRTRNIFGYVYLYTSSYGLTINQLVKQIQVIYSELDRPVFYILWNTRLNLQDVKFLTSDQIHDLIIRDDDRLSDLFSIHESGTITELIILFKKHLFNVKS